MDRTVKQLLSVLAVARHEADVAAAYRQAFAEKIKYPVTTIGKTDGVLFCEDLSTIFEFKYLKSFQNRLDLASVLVQVLWYLKKLEYNGEVLPKSVFVGDINECFVLPVSVLQDYLVRNGIDLSIPASRAAELCPGFISRISEDETIHPLIHDINERLNFDGVIEELKSIERDEPYVVPITADNLSGIFEHFKDCIVKGKVSENDLADLANVFFACLADKESTYLHPRLKNKLVTRNGIVSVNGNAFKSFFSHFKQDYIPSELESLIANKDRIIDDSHRRMTGAFFTPTVWVNEAHKMITNALGPNWRDEYAVWDCACGTGNLTRDYKFKELYLSTLEQSDVDTILTMEYNKGAEVFQYDFLSELELGNNVPAGLKKAFEENKKVLFLINPPFGTANEFGATGKDKAGIAKTYINEQMLKDNMGACAQQLYVQVLYRILKLCERYKIEDFAISFYSKPNFISAESFEAVRTYIEAEVRFLDGMLFNASHFSNVSNLWGVSFNIWSKKLC